MAASSLPLLALGPLGWLCPAPRWKPQSGAESQRSCSALGSSKPVGKLIRSRECE